MKQIMLGEQSNFGGIFANFPLAQVVGIKQWEYHYFHEGSS
jgi:hypothetical protein